MNNEKYFDGCRTNIDPNAVNKVKCKTCPFNKDSKGRYYNPELVGALMQTVITESNHICHTTDNTICRGSRNYQLEVFHQLGVIDKPTDEAWKKALDKK